MLVPETNPSAPTILGVELSLAIIIISSGVAGILCLSFILITIVVALLVAKCKKDQSSTLTVPLGETCHTTAAPPPPPLAASGNPLRAVSQDSSQEAEAAADVRCLDDGANKRRSHSSTVIGPAPSDARADAGNPLRAASLANVVSQAEAEAAADVRCQDDVANKRRRRSSTVIGAAPSDARADALFAVDKQGTHRRASTMTLSRPRARTDSISVKVVVDDDGVTTLYAHPVDQDEIDAWFDALEEKPKEARRVRSRASTEICAVARVRKTGTRAASASAPAKRAEAVAAPTKRASSTAAPRQRASSAAAAPTKRNSRARTPPLGISADADAHRVSAGAAALGDADTLREADDEEARGAVDTAAAARHPRNSALSKFLNLADAANGTCEAAPFEWEVHKDEAGRVYFHRASDDATVWIAPEGVLLEGWCTLEGAEGPYYHNDTTGETTWDAPLRPEFVVPE
jgi:hypothetical protein